MFAIVGIFLIAIMILAILSVLKKGKAKIEMQNVTPQGKAYHYYE